MAKKQKSPEENKTNYPALDCLSQNFVQCGQAIKSWIFQEKICEEQNAIVPTQENDCFCCTLNASRSIAQGGAYVID